MINIRFGNILNIRTYYYYIRYTQNAWLRYIYLYKFANHMSELHIPTIVHIERARVCCVVLSLFPSFSKVYLFLLVKLMHTDKIKTYRFIISVRFKCTIFTSNISNWNWNKSHWFVFIFIKKNLYLFCIL